MAKESNVELAQTMDSLLKSFVESLSKASLELEKKFEGEDFKKHPVKYAIPKMSIDMKLSLTVENGEVKGIFNKKSSGSSQELLSSIKMDVVAIPKGN